MENGILNTSASAGRSRNTAKALKAADSRRAGVAMGLLAGLTAAATVAMASIPGALASEKNRQQQAEVVPGQLIVKLKSTGSKATQKSLFIALQSRLGGGAIESVEAFATDEQLLLVKLSSGRSKSRLALEAAVSTLSEHPLVAYAEPNYVVRTLTTEQSAAAPNDTNFSQLWGLKNTGQADSQSNLGKAGSDINVTPLWDRGIVGDRRIKVAVIDTGIDYTHPDLQDNILVNRGEVAGNGKDDDGNGYIDDVYGMNFSGSQPAPNGLDDHNHGTHCAGTIGAMGNNGEGVVGVNWNVSLLPVKFLTASGSGSTAGAIEAINYARKMEVDVMSNSWGGGAFSQALKEAIQKTADAGIVFVAAAGNDSSNNDASATYPAGYEVDNIIAVAATDNQDKLARFSNYGARKVHVAAPGVNILSTVKQGGYKTFSGTSMATPHVAGVVALLLSEDRSLSYLDVKSRLIRTSDRVSSLRRKVISGGRVNAYNALMNVVPPNQEPDEAAWRTRSYSVASTHPYVERLDQTFKIQVPGAKFLRVVLDKIDTEAKYDVVSVQSPDGTVVEEFSGKGEGLVSDYVSGDTVIIRFRTDGSVNGWGFEINQVQVIE